MSKGSDFCSCRNVSIKYFQFICAFYAVTINRRDRERTGSVNCERSFLLTMPAVYVVDTPSSSSIPHAPVSVSVLVVFSFNVIIAFGTDFLIVISPLSLVGSLISVEVRFTLSKIR